MISYIISSYKIKKISICICSLEGKKVQSTKVCSLKSPKPKAKTNHCNSNINNTKLYAASVHYSQHHG